jgi:hypothetical protein
MSLSTSDYTTLGPYISGEIPEPWVHQFADADGTAIDITGYSVRVTYRLYSSTGYSTQTVRNGTLSDSTAGKAGYTWVSGDFDAAGTLHGELTIGNGSNRYARSFVCPVRSPAGGALPSI